MLHSEQQQRQTGLVLDILVIPTILHVAMMFVSCIVRGKLPGRIKDIICLHCLVCFVMFSHEHCAVDVIQGNKCPQYITFQ